MVIFGRWMLLKNHTFVFATYGSFLVLVWCSIWSSFPVITAHRHRHPYLVVPGILFGFSALLYFAIRVFFTRIYPSNHPSPIHFLLISSLIFSYKSKSNEIISQILTPFEFQLPKSLSKVLPYSFCSFFHFLYFYSNSVLPQRSYRRLTPLPYPNKDTAGLLLLKVPINTLHYSTITTWNGIFLFSLWPWGYLITRQLIRTGPWTFM
jgi:hypothetical protein